MPKLLKLFIVSILFLPSLGFAIDYNSDGLSDLAIYSSSTDSIHIVSGQGETLAELPVPTKAQRGSLFVAPVNGQLQVLRVLPRGELIVFDSNGTEQRIELGDTEDKFFMFFDIDDSGSFDLVTVTAKGNIRAQIDPLTRAGLAPLTAKSRSRLGTMHSVTKINGESFVASFLTSKKSRKRGRIQLTPLLASGKKAQSLRGTARRQPFPVLGSGESFVWLDGEKRNKLIYGIGGLNSKRVTKYRIDSDQKIVAGTFVAGAENQVAVLGRGLVEILDASSKAVLNSFPLTIASFSSSSSSNSPFPGGGGTNGTGACLADTVFNNLLKDAKAAARRGDFLALASANQLLGSLNLCPDQVTRVVNELGPLLGAAQLNTVTANSETGTENFLIEGPIYNEGVPEAQGQARNGCDTERPIADGNQGALAKNSDVRPTMVFLAPAGTFVESCSLINPTTGAIRDRLPLNGYSNGGRATLYGSKPMQSYPAKTWVRCSVDRGFETEKICYTTNKFNVERID